jgi:hypothetical protein
MLTPRFALRSIRASRSSPVDGELATAGVAAAVAVGATDALAEAVTSGESVGVCAQRLPASTREERQVKSVVFMIILLQ